MQTLKFIALFLIFSSIHCQAQTTSTSSEERKTIKINNDIGDLTISFVNGEITEFTINDNPVAKEDYKNYQSIIDQFSEEHVDCSESEEVDLEAEIHKKENNLRNKIVDLLISKSIIESSDKYKIKLKRNFLKVNGDVISEQIHEECLTYFEELYGHKLNSGSVVNFGKSKSRSSSSISIVD